MTELRNRAIENRLLPLDLRVESSNSLKTASSILITTQ